MNWPQTEFQKRFIDTADSLVMQCVTKLVPRLLRGRVKLSPVQQDDILKATQFKSQTAIMDA